jgi:hypothetical protein
MSGDDISVQRSLLASAVLGGVRIQMPTATPRDIGRHIVDHEPVNESVKDNGIDEK